MLAALALRVGGRATLDVRAWARQAACRGRGGCRGPPPGRPRRCDVPGTQRVDSPSVPPAARHQPDLGEVCGLSVFTLFHRVATVNPDGSGGNDVPPSDVTGQPAWSADGTRLGFARTTPPDGSHLASSRLASDGSDLQSRHDGQTGRRRRRALPFRPGMVARRQSDHLRGLPRSTRRSGRPACRRPRFEWST